MAKINLEDLRYVGLAANDAVEDVVTESSVEVEESVESEETSVESEEVVADVEEEIKENITPPVIEETISEIIAVRKLRIYSRPSTGVPARTFTGNVELIGHVDKFKIVKYVKPGFGVVKGYTLDL